MRRSEEDVRDPKWFPGDRYGAVAAVLVEYDDRVAVLTVWTRGGYKSEIRAAAIEAEAIAVRLVTQTSGEVPRGPASSSGFPAAKGGG